MGRDSWMLCHDSRCAAFIIFSFQEETTMCSYILIIVVLNTSRKDSLSTSLLKAETTRFIFFNTSPFCSDCWAAALLTTLESNSTKTQGVAVWKMLCSSSRPRPMFWHHCPKEKVMCKLCGPAGEMRAPFLASCTVHRHLLLGSVSMRTRAGSGWRL